MHIGVKIVTLKQFASNFLMEAGGNVAWGRDCASARVQGIFLLLGEDTAVILAQTRLGILQGNNVISSIKVAQSCVTTVTPQQFFSFTVRGRTKLPFDIQWGATICCRETDRRLYLLLPSLLPLPGYLARNKCSGLLSQYLLVFGTAMAELQGSYSLVTHYRSVSVAVITALTCFQL